MATWLPVRDAPSTPAVLEVAKAVERAAPRLRAAEGETGGLSRARLIKAVVPSLAAFDLTDKEVDSFSGREIDLWSAASGIAVSVQTGRAYTNNGALLAVLAAASHRPVDWLVIAVPDAYKGGAQAEPVVIQVRHLLRTRGITLDLDGVAIVPY